MEASGQLLRWRPARCVPRCGGRFRVRGNFVDAILHRRRSVSSCDSPSPPRMPMPPFCRDKWPQNRVRRGSRCWSCASSICSLPSRVRARWAKMSRISDVRSRILQLKIFSRLRLCAGERSSSKITVSTSCRRQKSANSSALPLPMNVAGFSDSIFWAVADDFAAGGGGQFAEFGERIADVRAVADLSSTPTRKTRSGRVFLVSMSAFNGLRTEGRQI
jgi:hypothetical protein